MKFSRTALAALLLAPVAMPAMAEVTFSPMATYHIIDTDHKFAGSPVDGNKVGYDLNLGYRFTQALGAELNYGNTKPEILGSEFKDERYTIDGVWHYYTSPSGRFQPYLSLGAGQERFPGGNKSTLANFASGIVYNLNE